MSRRCEMEINLKKLKQKGNRFTLESLELLEVNFPLYLPKIRPLRPREKADFMKKIDTDVIGKPFNTGKDNHVDNFELIKVNEAIRNTEVEYVGAELREAMESMKPIM